MQIVYLQGWNCWAFSWCTKGTDVFKQWMTFILPLKELARWALCDLLFSQRLSFYSDNEPQAWQHLIINQTLKNIAENSSRKPMKNNRKSRVVRWWLYVPVWPRPKVSCKINGPTVLISNLDIIDDWYLSWHYGSVSMKVGNGVKVLKKPSIFVHLHKFLSQLSELRTKRAAQWFYLPAAVNQTIVLLSSLIGS